MAWGLSIPRASGRLAGTCTPGPGLEDTLARLPLALLIAPLFVGCGMPESEFVVGYTEALCEHALTCGDQAELTFDGILTQDDCVLRKEEEVALWGAGCRFRGVDAEQCLLDMQTLQCPAAEGALADTPVSCEAVYVDCSKPPSADDIGDDEGDGSDGSDTDAPTEPSDTDEGDDTDAGSDTDAG